ncbi:hypothetical protein CLOP_g14314 [Closterium sp. NIES-67]|nr:hypothetical protein CLOP_g14314 [Closterium sp. NIES-67]
MPLLQQLHKEEAVKGLKLSGQPNDTKTILETARALLIESGLGNSTWPHAVRHATVAKSKGWLLWEPSKKVLFDSRDVKFVENIMYGKWEKQPEARVNQQLEEITMHFDLSEPEDS